MEHEQSTVASRRRARGTSTTARGEALERLKAIRNGVRRSESTGIKVDDRIYDTVCDEEYDALVAKRKAESRGFIVDDDGLGYGDEGEEEDWSKSGYAQSSDEDESEKPKRKRAEKKEAVKKPSSASSSLLAAAATMGKQRISSMFTSSVFNKSGGRDDKSKGLLCDSIVDDVIAECAPDENDRERHRMKKSRVSVGPKSVVSIKNENVPIVREKLLVNPHDLGKVTENDDIKGLVEKEESKQVKDEIRESSQALVDQLELDDLILKGVTQENLCSASETKDEPVVKELYFLNAKIKEETNDPASSAKTKWQEVRSEANDTSPSLNADEKSEFEVDSDGSLPFYILDAYEEFYNLNQGTLYLFGKVKVGNTYHSCCVVVKNMQRCVFAIPNESVFHNNLVLELEEDAALSSSNFRAKLLNVASGLKSEIVKHLLDLNISTFSMAPVKRKCTFVQSDIPGGENYVLKINYPFKDPPLAADLKGDSFCSLMGTHCSALELFLVKGKIQGPSWLSISKFSICPASQRVSWCKFEITVECPKDIRNATSSKNAPPVVVTAINLKTVINEKQSVNEIVSASVICCHTVKIDTPMMASEWKKPGALSHFTAVRKLEGGIFPMGFQKEATDINSKARSTVISYESSERALLNRLMIELHRLDSDVLVGHNISGFDLDVLLHRAQVLFPKGNIMWSKIGRLKRKTMPRLTKGSTIFGSGASPGIMSCIAGRLLCDTFICSRDLLKEVSYSLSHLAKTQLNQDRKEIAPHDIPRMFQTSESLLALVEYGETDAWLSMELMFHLSVLPLTRQLTNISGNLWGKTLQGARAQRSEYLLLHAFHAKKYIVPDKFTSQAKEINLAKRKTSGAGDRNAENFEDNTNVEIEVPNGHHGKGKKGPSYAGGLVLEPKRGLYDKYILLLDFNSLYPSIIQEYNICFTTVERSCEGSSPRLPSSKTTGVLPELLKNLVQRRRVVKKWQKTASGLKFEQFEIQQQALKLTANSMYGCLGFSNSRFYAKPLAELITLQGREILQSTVDLVQNNLNLEVIYGDTDSIMIYTGVDDIKEAKAMAGKVIQEVNKKYRCLEIDLDGVYKRMLLLKKKKYAAVKVQSKDGIPYEVIERKGLDMVRRDWSLLSKDLGDFCLSQILSGGSCEDVVESIHNSLMKVQEEMRKGEVALEKYVITKTLTKPPEAYPDGRNQPHVQVALRLKQDGYSTGCSAGDTVPYIICCEQVEQEATSSSGSGIALRARHPEDLKKDNGKWRIDIDYYLSQQIHPVVSRLCASIQGTSPERLAECLRLDSSKFRSKSSEAVSNGPSISVLCATDDEERYRGCAPLMLTCRSCSCTFNCPAIGSSVSEKPARLQAEGSTRNFWDTMRCPKCPEDNDEARISAVIMANQVKKQADGFISTYYKNTMTCDDETCKHTTRSLNLRLVGDSEKGTVCPNYPRCNGRLVRKYTDADLYKQLSYFCHVLDTVRCLDKMEASTRTRVEQEFTRIRPVVELAASTIHKINDSCAYGWVNLQDLFPTI